MPEAGSRRLQESQRIALETEKQGADILRYLVGRHEQIENARNTVRPFPPPPCGAILTVFFFFFFCFSSKLRIILSSARPGRSRR